MPREPPRASGWRWQRRGPAAANDSHARPVPSQPAPVCHAGCRPEAVGVAVPGLLQTATGTCPGRPAAVGGTGTLAEPAAGRNMGTEAELPDSGGGPPVGAGCMCIVSLLAWPTGLCTCAGAWGPARTGVSGRAPTVCAPPTCLAARSSGAPVGSQSCWQPAAVGVAVPGVLSAGVCTEEPPDGPMTLTCIVCCASSSTGAETRRAFGGGPEATWKT
mmetsp:Transcript_95018/g.247494  ORF Transcript_95018/g.247494 Transcript_95018/m.247494 type:complete len:217 (-) Transcript_95018:554-1204(-)